MSIVINGNVYISGYDKSLDDFDSELDDFDNFEDEDGCDGNCEDCQLDEDEDKYDLLLDKYANLIQNNCICTSCLKELLDKFTDEFLDFLDLD